MVLKYVTYSLLLEMQTNLEFWSFLVKVICCTVTKIKAKSKEIATEIACIVLVTYNVVCKNNFFPVQLRNQ